MFKPKLAACAKEFYAKFRKEAGFPTNQPISSTVVPPSGPISLDEYFCEISLPEFRDDENLRILFKFLLSCKLETISWDLVKALLISKDEVLLQKSRKLLQGKKTSEKHNQKTSVKRARELSKSDANLVFL